jgi:hypothetical protein
LCLEPYLRTNSGLHFCWMHSFPPFWCFLIRISLVEWRGVIAYEVWAWLSEAGDPFQILDTSRSGLRGKNYVHIDISWRLSISVFTREKLWQRFWWPQDIWLWGWQIKLSTAIVCDFVRTFDLELFSTGQLLADDNANNDIARNLICVVKWPLDRLRRRTLYTEYNAGCWYCIQGWYNTTDIGQTTTDRWILINGVAMFSKNQWFQNLQK